MAFWDTGSELPVLMVISVKGVVPMDVSSFANCVSYSFSNVSNLDCMPGLTYDEGVKNI